MHDDCVQNGISLYRQNSWRYRNLCRNKNRNIHASFRTIKERSYLHYNIKHQADINNLLMSDKRKEEIAITFQKSCIKCTKTISTFQAVFVWTWIPESEIKNQAACLLKLMLFAFIGQSQGDDLYFSSQ